MAKSMLARGAALIVMLAVSMPAAAQEATAAGEDVETATGRAPDEAAPQPAPFFEAVAERYRRLTAYEDVADVAEVIARAGRPPVRVETQIACKLDGEGLRVVTPGSQVREGVGLDLPIDTSPAMEALVLRYNLWLAPHMALHFADEPLKDLRLGVPEGFVPAAAGIAVVDDKRTVHLELESADSPSAADGEGTAKFEFWVDPESMLIQRIEGRQRLPDGADYRTTLDIKPVRVAPEA
jgi:hypothetical protein